MEAGRSRRNELLLSGGNCFQDTLEDCVCESKVQSH